MSRLSPRARRALFVLHLVTALGWFGADLTLLTLGIAGLRGADPEAVYPTAALIITYVFAPLSAVTWLVGVVTALSTRWGLLRWRWVLVKFVVTTVLMGAVLLILLPRMRLLGELGATAPDDLRSDLVYAPAVSSTVMVVLSVISAYKPWGRLRQENSVVRTPVTAGQEA
jgi:hypothetical protein